MATTAIATSYLSQARAYLLQHGKATAKQLDDFIVQQGLVVKPCSSISALTRLETNGEAKKELVEAKRKYNLFIATPLLGQPTYKQRLNAAVNYAPTPEGVLMLQNIVTPKANAVRLWDEA